MDESIRFYDPCLMMMLWSKQTGEIQIIFFFYNSRWRRFF